MIAVGRGKLRDDFPIRLSTEKFDASVTRTNSELHHIVTSVLGEAPTG
jgi:hypothetical protein